MTGRVTTPARPRAPPRGTRANLRTSRCGSRARTTTPSSVSVRSSIGAPSAYRSESTRPSSYGTSSRTSSKRSAKRSAMRAFSSSIPSPVAAEISIAPGKRFATRRRARRSSRSTLLTTSSTGISPAPISASTISTESICSTSTSSGSEPSTTWRTRSATSVSSSVDAKPSTSCVGRRRMKPTVSVTR